MGEEPELLPDFEAVQRGLAQRTGTGSSMAIFGRPDGGGHSRGPLGGTFTGSCSGLIRQRDSAHGYESDKSQPGKAWYSRSLAFHDWIVARSTLSGRVGPRD